jgi:hypothetical protein
VCAAYIFEAGFFDQREVITDEIEMPVPQQWRDRFKNRPCRRTNAGRSRVSRSASICNSVGSGDVVAAGASAVAVSAVGALVFGDVSFDGEP